MKKIILGLSLLLSSCATYSGLDPASGHILRQRGDKATVIFTEADGKGFGYADFKIDAEKDSVVIIIRR